MTDAYASFLRDKIRLAPVSGLQVTGDEVKPILKPHQRDITVWAVRGGTVPYRALKLGRRGRAVELNPGYFLDGIKYLQAMEREVSTPTMFDIFDQGEAA